ncbi:BolA/IbaG family iron-sulfur metabolism protein [Aquicoccus sp. SCR17]|nr:BolA/IbaG family iron-sulfur metabolism protein [Carideicomes alvinocaridis]
MTRTEEIRQKLERAFQPSHLEVVDESERHRGHAGYQEGGESHFRVTLRSAELAAKPRLARHRAVHEALGRDLMGRIHALALDIDG